MAQGQRLAHRIGVMMDGELIQVGRPEDIFYAPSDVRVARFVGVENILKGRITANEGGLARVETNGQSLEVVTDHRLGEEVHVFIRPEEIIVSLQAPYSSARNAFSGQVSLVALSGPYARAEIDCGFTLVALITRRSAEELGLKIGQKVNASFKATAIHVISLG
jgi:molybdopterin-binding protein